MKRFVEFVSVRFNVLCASLCVATSVLAMLASSVAAETSGAFIGAEIGMSGGGQNLATINAKPQVPMCNAAPLGKEEARS